MKCKNCGKVIDYRSERCSTCSSLALKYTDDGISYLFSLYKKQHITIRELLKLKGLLKEEENDWNRFRENVKINLKKNGFDGTIERVNKSKKVGSSRRAASTKGKRIKDKYSHIDVCEMCGNKNGEMIAHHMLPHSWGGDTNRKNIIFICNDCHAVIHKKLSKILSANLRHEIMRENKDRYWNMVKDIYNR
jgi:arsenate reductase-like glutaredoxin family protein